MTEKEGDVYAWGDNSYSQLGIKLPGQKTYADTPQIIPKFKGLENCKVKKVFATDLTSYAILDFKLN